MPFENANQVQVFTLLFMLKAFLEGRKIRVLYIFALPLIYSFGTKYFNYTIKIERKNMKIKKKTIEFNIKTLNPIALKLQVISNSGEHNSIYI